MLDSSEFIPVSATDIMGNCFFWHTLIMLHLSHPLPHLDSLSCLLQVPIKMFHCVNYFHFLPIVFAMNFINHLIADIVRAWVCPDSIDQFRLLWTSIIPSNWIRNWTRNCLPSSFWLECVGEMRWPPLASTVWHIQLAFTTVLVGTWTGSFRNTILALFCKNISPMLHRRSL